MNKLNADKFLAGQKACKAGEPCKVGADEDFVRGYSAQYDLEQALEYNPKAKHPEIERAKGVMA